MEDIADQAQLGKGTLYLYFKTKEDLLLGIAVRRQHKLLAVYEGIVADEASGAVQLRALIETWTDHMTSSPQHLRMVMSRWVCATPFQHQGGEEFRSNVRQIFEVFKGAVERGQADGSVRDDLEPVRLALHLWSGANGALLSQLQQQCLPPDSILGAHAPSIDEHLDFLIDALSPARVSRPASRAIPTSEAS